MRTNIDIDDALMADAQRASGLPTKKAAVEEGLRLLIRVRAQEGLLELGGKFQWIGDLEQGRLGRNTD